MQKNTTKNATDTANPERHWFGFQSVNDGEKTGRVMDVFENVAPKYDIMNDAMSGGLHRLWKDDLIRQIRPRGHEDFLDVAGGTGDIAFRIRKKAGPGTKITVCDINSEMLRVGQERAIDRGYIDGFEWITGNAECLPFADNSYDVYTIAFGLRNVSKIDDALREAYRVLRPGGRFYCMEFSKVTNPALAKLYDIYSFNVIPKLGKLIANDEDSYQYLVESIRQFPSQENLKKRILDAGFDRVTYRNLTFGTVAIHCGWRL